MVYAASVLGPSVGRKKISNIKRRNMKVDVLLGLQWGDEGKGKVVDVLTPRYDVVARFQGGPNAGHTLEFEGQKYVLRSIPSGIFQGNKVNIIGNGVVLDPALFKAEAEALEASGHPLKIPILFVPILKRLVIYCMLLPNWFTLIRKMEKIMCWRIFLLLNM
jgi:hypothetical protein